MPPNDVSTADRFDMAAWRFKIGQITQVDAAEFLEIHKQTISDTERGEAVSRKVLRLACAAALLGVVEYDGHQIEFGRIKRTGKRQSRLRNE